MKKIPMFIILGTCLTIFTNPVFPQSFVLSAEVPYSFDFKEADDGGKLEIEGAASGGMIYLKLPFSLGFGLESYEIPLKGGAENSISISMVDLFYTLPIPSIDLSFGGGIGNTRVVGDSEAGYKSTPSRQYFVTIGIPIFLLVNLNLGYHQVTARVKAAEDEDARLEASGNLITAGFGVSF